MKTGHFPNDAPRNPVLPPHFPIGETAISPFFSLEKYRFPSRSQPFPAIL